MIGNEVLNDVLKDAKHREVLFKKLPFYTLLEISPIFEKLPYETLQNAVVFDVGANHGLWSVALTGMLRDRLGAVHMFEPLPGNLAEIDAHIAMGLYQGLEDRLVINPIALSDRAGEAEIHFEVAASDLASIDTDYCDLPGRRVALDKSATIPTQTLSAYCTAQGIAKIDILKIDVEGHEMPVLQGAAPMFAAGAIRACLFEFGSHQLARHDTFHDFFAFFQNHGYDLYGIREPWGSLRPITKYVVAEEVYNRVRMFLAVLPDDRISPT